VVILPFEPVDPVNKKSWLWVSGGQRLFVVHGLPTTVFMTVWRSQFDHKSPGLEKLA
jgi:hypothetical protein